MDREWMELFREEPEMLPSKNGLQWVPLFPREVGDEPDQSSDKVLKRTRRILADY